MKIVLKILTSLLFAGPIVFLIITSFSAEPEVIKFFLQYQASDVLIQTFGYGVVIAFISTVCGAFWGYACAHYDFPGRRIWVWLLPAPLAVPFYVYAFIYLSIWTSWMGYSRPEWLLIMFFSLAGSAYVYLLSYQTFRFEPRELRESSEMMGLSKREYFWVIRWPLSRPLIFAGFFVVLTEFIADFGAVQLFGLRTFSTAIYSMWTSYLSFTTASLVSLMLLFGVLIILFLQSRIQSFSYTQRQIKNIRPRFAWQLTVAACIYTTVSFIGPVIWLLHLSIKNFNFDFIPFFINTSILSTTFAVGLTLIVSLVVFQTSRQSRLFPAFLQFGYALPGTMLAVAVTVPFFYLQRWFDGFSRTAIMAIILMFMAWMIRFLKVTWEPIAKDRNQMPLSLEEAASIYEKNYLVRWRSLFTPIIKGGMLSSLMLLLLETAKELPIALLTRPLGWETLAIKVFEYTSESDWYRAALPALLIVLFGCVGLALFLRESETNA